MGSMHEVEINGYTFMMEASLVKNGVVVPPEWGDLLYDGIFLFSLKIALELYQDFYEWAYAGEYYQPFIPTDREVPDYLKSYRDPFIEELVNLSQQMLEAHYAREAEHKVKRERGGDWKNSYPGYIYLIRAITPDNHYKIGLSNKPVKRIESLGVRLPFPIEILHLIKTDNMAIAEHELHERYADKRVNGEWFQLTDEDVQTICAMEQIIIEDKN